MTDRFEYECARCGVVTVHGPSGGTLGCGNVPSDDCPATAQDIAVTVVSSDGARKPFGTMASIGVQEATQR